MKATTIWESASRPLFVRTVWLEGTELRPGLQRHFLLDYVTKRPFERLNSAINPVSQSRKNTLKSSYSYDFQDYEDHFASDEEVFLIDSAKLKLHEPVKQNFSKSGSKSTGSKPRRASVLSRKYQSYDSYYNNVHSKSANYCHRISDISDFYSRRSSLQDINNEKVSTLDEKLAERVLNWLDLAGNGDLLKNLQDYKEMEVKLTKTSKLRRDSIRKVHDTGKNNNTTPLPINKAKTNKAKLNTSFQAENISLKPPAEPVKHITIIFNKEGQPIRFNRPAKNIDLCALSASPSTTRRLAGTLASARLYKSAENSRLNTERSRHSKPRNLDQSYSARRRLDTVADLTNSNLQKRLKDSSTMGSYNSLHDAKKQLHIFMPTLPKKGVVMGPCGTEDGVSELSHNLNEYCKV
ncbi:uncharacterized protein [Musca autumnalis]|uniref:uncharacterized protein n=1 Tax=Musca autumnalis TaxID=221902 RepID=UPI003CE9916B